MSNTSHCDYIGCFSKENVINGYCPKHSSSIIARQSFHLSNFQTEDFKQQFQNDPTITGMFESLFNSTSSGHVYDRLEELKKDILSNTPLNASMGTSTVTNDTTPTDTTPMITDHTEITQNSPTTLHAKLKQNIELKHHQSRSKVSSQKTRKVLKHIKRTIHQKTNGEKVTNEEIFSVDDSCTSKLKTTEDIVKFVTLTTERYEEKINTYAQDKELVFSSLTKWYDKLSYDCTRKNIIWDCSTENLLSTTSRKTQNIILNMKLFHTLWSSTPLTYELPTLQGITYYTIDELPDGSRKVFHCKFSNSKLNSDYALVIVPEILLRSIPQYLPTIHAFFQTKFIPFKKSYMEHQKTKEELASKVNDDEAQSKLLDILLDEDEQNGMIELNAQIPEINPRVCYIKQNNM